MFASRMRLRCRPSASITGERRMRLNASARKMLISCSYRFGIHDVKELELMGRVTEQGYVWDEKVVKRAIPPANTLELRKNALMGGRRR